MLPKLALALRVGPSATVILGHRGTCTYLLRSSLNDAFVYLRGGTVCWYAAARRRSIPFETALVLMGDHIRYIYLTQELSDASRL